MKKITIPNWLKEIIVYEVGKAYDLGYFDCQDALRMIQTRKAKDTDEGWSKHSSEIIKQVEFYLSRKK